MAAFLLENLPLTLTVTVVSIVKVGLGWSVLTQVALLTENLPDLDSLWFPP